MVRRTLTRKQEQFAVLVAQGAPATAAYRQHYNVGRMKAETVHKRASELKKNGEVAGRIAELRAPAIAELEARVLVDLGRTLFENARVAFSDVRRVLNDDGTFKPPAEWDKDVAAAVASIKVREQFGEGKNGKIQIGQTVEIKLWDKGAALDRLGRHLGMYEMDRGRKPTNLFAGLPRERVKAILEALARERR